MDLGVCSTDAVSFRAVSTTNIVFSTLISKKFQLDLMDAIAAFLVLRNATFKLLRFSYKLMRSTLRRCGM